MQYKIDDSTLDLLWTALNEQPRHPKIHQAERHFQRWFRRGWVAHHDIEDIIDLLDARLSNNRLRICEFSKLFGFHWETVYYRPKARSIYVSGFEYLRVESAAVFLILLERLGFQIDASYLVKLLLPGIKFRKKEMFSDYELELFWFEKQRHKQVGIRLSTEAAEPWDEPQKTIKTSTGYTISLDLNEKAEPTSIFIKAPKFRRLKEPVVVTCKECGVEWRKGDPDSSELHRKEHKRRMAYLHPQPVAKLLTELKEHDDAELVTSSSPAWKHREMYERALAFKRELHFDFIQWESPEYNSDPKAHGFLFADEQGAIIGACAFRDHTGDRDQQLWALDWVWICPKERNKGHLAKRWLAFRERFGDFVVTSPVSEELQGFLKKHGDSMLMKYPESRNVLIL